MLLPDIQTMCDASLPISVITDYFLEIVEYELRRTIGPTFWGKVQFDENNLSLSYESLVEAFKYLHEMVTSDFLSVIQLLGEEALLSTEDNCKEKVNLQNDVHQKIFAIIFYITPEYFSSLIDCFYTSAFKVFRNHEPIEDANESFADDSLIECGGCGRLSEECACREITREFHAMNKYLADLGLLDRVCGQCVSGIINEQIRQYIDHITEGNFESSFIDNLEQWLETKVVAWLTWLYDGTNAWSSSEKFRNRLSKYLHTSYATARIQELFNIIIDYPESEPAIFDLKICLERTNLRSTLVASLKSALETRLLHPGVNTSDILTAYISAIRALRVLDPTGVILDLVCQPVRKYLRNRSDTVRCIVSNLTEDGCSDLCDELIKRQPLVLDDSCYSEDATENWENWVPDPIDAVPGKTSKSGRTSDIISMLVNIYGSKELFVHEYRNLLADRILSQFSYETCKEIRYLELLKLRFGEAQLHYCEVMIKDVADSRRINSHICDQREKLEQADKIDFNSMILSAQFWPSFREEKMTLPAELQAELNNYKKSYETLKGNRTLCWKPHLGLMDVEVELKDRKLNLKVSPVHATILWHFQTESKWSIDDLSTEMQMPSSALRRKIAFWQSQGVLREEAVDTFVLYEEQKHGSKPVDIVHVDDEGMESAMASLQDQREEELQVYWSYIVGMLTNLESLPLERIHSMLRMFAMQGPTTTECSLHELKGFLDRKVRELKLVYVSGVYRLAPKAGH